MGQLRNRTYILTQCSIAVVLSRVPPATWGDPFMAYQHPLGLWKMRVGALLHAARIVVFERNQWLAHAVIRPRARSRVCTHPSPSCFCLRVVELYYRLIRW